jgi:hypothetical protein
VKRFVKNITFGLPVAVLFGVVLQPEFSRHVFMTHWLAGTAGAYAADVVLIWWQRRNP